MTDANVTTQSRPILEANGITVRFGALVALNNVDIAVPERKIVGLVGPNGAGKSTMFAVVSGLQPADTGEVFFNGDDITKLTPRNRARKGIARTFQHPELFSHLTVREHLVLADRVVNAYSRLWSDMFTGRGLRRPDPAETERVDQLLERFQLTRIASRPVEGMPLGTSRVIELARALVLKPKLLMLDEPGSGLDAGEREHLVETLKSLPTEDDMSILLVEHDVEMVLSLSNFVYVLNFGHRIAAGTPEQVRASEEVRTAYLGDMATAGDH